MEDSKEAMVSAGEFIKDRLYFVTLNTTELPKSTSMTHFFSIDRKLCYESFFDDFGPLNLSMLYHYCMKLNRLLVSSALEKMKIVHTTINIPEKRVNAAFLIGSYAIIYLNFDPVKAYEVLTKNNRMPYINFRDASKGLDGYTIKLLDCFKGLHKAYHFGFFDFSLFNYEHYEHYERVENGDLNWIVPSKFLGFCGPHNRSRVLNGYPLHSPEFYFEYFHRHHVTTIIRLNKRVYDSNKFVLAGFHHYDLYFVDGSTPTDKILNDFLQICEKSEGAIAIHCKAGLGRTGTLIGCYLMKHYKFTAHEAIAWIRICRPGSVIGHQQEWLERKQEMMYKEGEAYRKRLGMKSLPKHKYGIYSKRVPKEGVENTKDGRLHDKVTRILKKVDTMQLNDSTDRDDNDDSMTQGDQLNQIKAKRQCQSMTQTTERRAYRSQLLDTPPLSRVSKGLSPATKSSTPSNSRVLIKRNEAVEQPQLQSGQLTPRRMSQRKAAILKAASCAARNGKPKVTPKKNENGWILEDVKVEPCNGDKKDTKVAVVKRGKRALTIEKDKTSPRSVKVLRRSHVSTPSDVDVKPSKIHLPLVKSTK